jgi:Mrp family chromosome partitioning ATPase
MPLIQSKMERFTHKILVLSGKGGVGKSTLTTQLAYTLAEHMSQPLQVSVMDVDVCGPSVPRMLGVENERIHASSSGWQPVYARDTLAVVSAAFLLDRDDQAVIWRGPKKNGLIKQFLRDVEWPLEEDEMESILLVDTPPGTSDEHLSIAQLLKPSGNVYAVIVTTPQELALSDVRKEIDFCIKLKIPIVGVVENMATFVCPSCHAPSDIFPALTGGAQALCQSQNLFFLGSLPLDPRMGYCCDRGLSFLEENADTPAAVSLRHIAQSESVLHPLTYVALVSQLHQA